MTRPRSKDTAETLQAKNGPQSVPRILIVDDSVETRFIYKRFLARSTLDCTVSEAETVAEALGLLNDERFDCVLLDFCLPDADGLELLAEIAASDRINVPVVMITGQGSEPVAVEAMKLGAKDYLVKDRIDQERLLSAVEYALDKAQTERALQIYREELEEQSVTDALTGLHNRRHLFAQLEIELSRASRYGTPLCLLMIDLDHFKSLNDEHGHLVGDRVLENFGKMLKRVARTTDVAARYGGEEFCIVLTNTDLTGGLYFAERICAEARALRHGENGLTVTCSAGLAEICGPVDAETLIQRADRALYRAKHLGRDQVAVYDNLESASA